MTTQIPYIESAQRITGRDSPAVTRAFAILKILRTRPSLSITEIAEELHLPRSTTHGLVHTLVRLGCLAPVPEDSKRFNLGLLLHELGSAYLATIDLAREGLQVARSISETCGETVHLAVLDGMEVVYIAKVDSIHPVRMVSAVGVRLPAHCTGVGKALLSGLSANELRRRFNGGSSLRPMTPNSITSFEALEAELANVQRNGLAIDNCESNSDVHCVASPVFNHLGNIVAALSISVPVSRGDADGSWPGRLAPLIQVGGQELSRRMGYGSNMSGRKP
jgi:IclR family transcriptional regulator, KDG regulon repressor